MPHIGLILTIIGTRHNRNWHYLGPLLAPCRFTVSRWGVYTPHIPILTILNTSLTAIGTKLAPMEEVLLWSKCLRFGLPHGAIWIPSSKQRKCCSIKKDGVFGTKIRERNSILLCP